MNKVKKFLAIIENLIFMIFCMIVILFLVQLFCFTSFKIPSDSMGPALKDGDRILVNKMIKGARLFNVFAALDNKDVTIYRMPGLGHFKRNDVLVFNFPYQMNRWDSIRMNVMQYYVKRCIALPGDTLEIRGGFYKVRGCREQLGNYEAQQYLAGLQQPEKQGIVVKPRMEYSRVRAIAYPTKGSDCNNEPYYLSFIQTTDRMGAKEKNRTKTGTGVYW